MMAFSIAQPAQVLLVVRLAELDQQDRLRRLAHEFVERRPEHRDLARELDHGAVDQFDRDRRRCTMLRVASIAARKLPKCTAPTARRPSNGESFSSMRVEKPSVPSEPTRICARLMSLRPRYWPSRARRDCSRRPGAAPSGSAPRSRPSRARRARADRCASGRSSGGTLLTMPPIGPEMRRACRRPESHRSRARCRAWCRSAASGRRRNCCRPCRRWWRARTWRYRPETTARAALSCRLRSSSTMPGSTVQRARLTSRSRMRVEIFGAIDHQRLVDRLPGLRGAAAARENRHAFGARDARSPVRLLRRCAARRRRAASIW